MRYKVYKNISKTIIIHLLYNKKINQYNIFIYYLNLSIP